MFVAEAGLQLEKMRNKSSRKAQLITQEDDSEKGTKAPYSNDEDKVCSLSSNCHLQVSLHLFLRASSS